MTDAIPAPACAVSPTDFTEQIMPLMPWRAAAIEPVFCSLFLRATLESDGAAR